MSDSRRPGRSSGAALPPGAGRYVAPTPQPGSAAVHPPVAGGPRTVAV